MGVGARPQAEVMQQRDTSLVPIADTYVRQGSPNQNQGAELILRLQSSGKNRALLRWDQLVLAQAATGGTLVAARLELTIADLADNWSAAGRTVDLHRLTHAWTELGATWNCAVDSVPGNSRADCTGASAWDMDHSASYPWVATRTATALLRNGQTGVVTFDVTADVQAWLAGQQPNYGWILKKTVEGDPGKVDFGSRQSGVAPRLVLRVESTADTTRPLVPESMDFPDDSLHTVEDSTNPGDILYRTLADVIFDDSVSGITIRAFLRKYQAVVVGGLPASRGYTLQFPDAGSTIDSLRALLRRMGDEPGVFVVLSLARSSRPVEPDGRYPADGLNLGRSSWFDPNSAFTWAGLAIRAPLAWGCENGLYGSAGPRVGVVEARSGQLHDDLSGSVVVGYVPEPFGKTATASESTLIEEVRHSNAVAGLIGAAGDNGKGAAGMVWGGRLRLYALEPAGKLLTWKSINRVFLEYVLPRLVADGVRIVNLSVALGGPPADSQAQRYLLRELSRFLRSNPGALLVKSTGNQTSRLDLNQLLAVRSGNGLGLLAALARLKRDSAAFRDRILLVSGTQRGGALWADPSHGQGANFVRGGVTEIAAPAAQVATLDHPALGEDAILQSGTSFSAALVSGVAAQLLAMDPSLPADSVKDYILRGAREPRLSSTTGQMVRPPAVSGAPETVYQLDAYGALTLLSSERVGTPICGYPVSLALNADGFLTGTEIVLGRPGAPSILAVPGAHGIGGPSVAQGGRLLSVFDSDENGSTQSILMDHRGRPVGAAPDVQRMFLEKDTVDELLPGVAGRTLPWSVYIRRGASDDTLDFVRALVAPGDLPNVIGGGAWFAPAGDVAVVLYAALVNDQCFEGNPWIAQWMMVPLSGGGPMPIGEFRHCGPPSNVVIPIPYAAAWSHDSRRAALVSYYWRGPSDWGGTITTVLRSGGVQEDEVPGVRFELPVYLSDDSLLRVEQGNTSGGCDVVLRSASNPGTVVSSAPGSYTDCGWAVLVIPNAPPSRTLVAAGGNRAGGAGPSRSGGFALTEPAQILNRRATAAAWRRYSPRRVQVN